MPERECPPPKDNSYLCPDQFWLNGKRIDIYGVFHHEKTLEEFSPVLRDGIREASLVFLEVAPTASGIYTEEAIVTVLANRWRKKQEEKGAPSHDRD